MYSSDRQALDPLEPPPVSERTVARVGGAAGAVAFVAAATGLVFSLLDGSSAWIADYVVPFRVILSVAALIVAGISLTLRPRWTPSWLFAAGTCLIAGFGLPSSWDTFRLVAFVFCGLSLVGALLSALPFGWRVTIATAAALYHFGGIFNAIIMPPPTPDLASNIWVVAYRPYLGFAYLNNAYQFYSPDPGPASELWFCIYYANRPDDPVVFEELKEFDGEPVRDSSGNLVYQPMLDEDGDSTGKPIYDAQGNSIFDAPRDKHGNKTQRPKLDFDGNPEFLRESVWLKVPRRPRDYRDPLGQAYYRRLSLTENASNGLALTQLPDSVRAKIWERRQSYPIPVTQNDANQFRWPNETIQHMVVPAYVQYVAHEYQRGDRPITGIKVYRVEHQIITPRGFVGAEMNGRTVRYHPYDKNTYYPYYMGEFTVDGELKVKNDPMLFWLVPIVANPLATTEEFNKQDSRHLTSQEYRRLYVDYVVEHAKSNHMKGELMKGERK